MIDILFITNVPSPYRIDFFNELGKHCNLVVLFQKKKSKERKTYWDNFSVLNFKCHFIGGINTSTDSSFSFKITKYIKKYKNFKIVVDGISPIANIYSIFYMKRHKIPYFIEIDGGNPNLNSAGIINKLKTRFKFKICEGANGYFSSGKSADEYLIKYGANVERIYRYNFTSLFEADISKHPISLDEKKQKKIDIGFREEKIVVTVGRFSYKNGYGKGFDIFCEVAKRLNKKNIGFYIIGDEPTKEFVDLKNDENINNLHFLPFFKKKELFEIYRVCDLTMILSRGDVWGLVVNESLSCGIPVISSNLCLAGCELIKNGINGFVVTLDDIDNIVACVEEIIMKKQDYYWRRCINSIKDYTIEKMVDTHLKVLGAKYEALG